MSDLEGRQRLDDMPGALRWSLVSIKEVGFPIVACLFLFYMSAVTLNKMTLALEKVTTGLNTVTSAVQAMQANDADLKETLHANQKAIIENQNAIRDEIMRRKGR